MRLVYTATGQPVNIGDRHTVGGFTLVIAATPKPHKPDSEGKIDFHVEGEDRGPTYGCSVIGASQVKTPGDGLVIGYLQPLSVFTGAY